MHYGDARTNPIAVTNLSAGDVVLRPTKPDGANVEWFPLRARQHGFLGGGWSDDGSVTVQIYTASCDYLGDLRQTKPQAVEISPEGAIAAAPRTVWTGDYSDLLTAILVACPEGSSHPLAGLVPFKTFSPGWLADHDLLSPEPGESDALTPDPTPDF